MRTKVITSTFPLDNKGCPTNIEFASTYYTKWFTPNKILVAAATRIEDKVRQNPTFNRGKHHFFSDQSRFP